MSNRPAQHPTTGAPRWRLTDASALRWAQWETETSLFNGDTGETHLLSEFPVYILATLANEPLSLRELAETAAQACDVENMDSWQGQVQTVLDDLAGLELVQQQDW